jgi:hypothetical protein
MSEKIELVDLVKGRDFLREIHRAASLSYEHKRETGFNVYCDEQISQPYVNRAVLGHNTSIETDMTTEAKHEPQYGAHIPMYNYRLVDVHFHPPKSNLHPSGADINENLAARRVGVNLRESSSHEREVYEDEQETKQIGYEIDFPNPVSMIGLVRDKPENIELLVYQGITEGPITFDTFSEFVADYCQKLYGGEYEPMIFHAFGFSTRFTSTKRVVEFLNDSKYLQAVDVKIRNGKLSDKDLEKLRKFELIQTRFFPEKTDSEDD